MAASFKTKNPNDQARATCDQLIEGAAEQMQAAGAPVEMILDRLLTYAAAQACVLDGSRSTAKKFRVLADRIRGGLFNSITGEGVRH